MANKPYFIKTADVGLYGVGTTAVIRLELVEPVSMGMTYTELAPAQFKTILNQVGKTTLSGVMGGLVICDDATNPPTFVKGINPSTL